MNNTPEEMISIPKTVLDKIRDIITKNPKEITVHEEPDNCGISEAGSGVLLGGVDNVATKESNNE